jgi:hypothetical protein
MLNTLAFKMQKKYQEAAENPFRVGKNLNQHKMKNQLSNLAKTSMITLLSIYAIAISSCQKEELVPPGIIPAHSTSADESKIKPPEVPDIIKVPEGNKVIWHAYASGVQIYQVTQSLTDPTVYLWTFIAPSATLYGNSSYSTVVGTHYAGPTWQATVGRKAGQFVVGLKLQSSIVDATAVAWLLLQSVPSTDVNYYDQVTYIQRVNTTGGLAPVTGADADHLGEQASIPYTAEYYFYGAN